jgi:transaldolase
MNPISTLQSFGQSIWYDNIQRRLLENGELAAMIAGDEIRGVTSNPSIFQNAIAKSHDYDSALEPLARSGSGAEEIFYQLAFQDIRAAADLFLPVFTKSKGGDGYVSLEVNPYLAHDTQGTINEARHLWQLVDRPNLMVKIPATPEGIPAISQVISAGINVNVTLIFSLSRYAQVMEAYLTGLEQRYRKGLSITSIASVASFFVSRVDSKVDLQLQKMAAKGGPDAAKAISLMGKAAIANAKLAYEQFHAIFQSERFRSLDKAGAKRQRPLWASTSTKNPAYRDVLYIEELIGPETVNTIPPQTFEAFKDHGIPRLSLENDLEAAHHNIDELEKTGVSMQAVTQELEDEGVKAFSDSFGALIKTIEERSAAARS